MEEKIVAELMEKFGLTPESVKVTSPRRISLQVEYALLCEVLEFLYRWHDFKLLCAITGMDEGENLAVIYHIAQISGGIIINLKTSVDKLVPILRTVSGYYPPAQVYEREIVDLLGFKVEGLPPGARYPLTDDWPPGEYPLRKDWHCLGQ